ncbi:MAG: signal peptide peptidase SppA [Hyphomicrobiales bacterium]|nr:signal peptide peptidase SppA [Hyphomicrobiales bacterium]MDE2113572.1 signal peptide peptidase SppA [Hyphomicrobiales bacterium]
MSPSSPDELVDRRKLRRRVSFWRLVSLILALSALLIIGARLAPNKASSGKTQHIARIAIKGLIVGDESTIKLIHDAAEAPQVAGIILDIDSPGGTTTGSEKIYDAIRVAAVKKPVVAEVGTLAASGAYIAALGSDHIVAYGNSLVGSIGVLFQYPNFYKLLNNVGVSVEEVKSSPLKAAPNGMEPTSDAARAALASVVADSYAWFKQLVQTRRHMSDAELGAVDDGRVFTARQGLPLKLVDAIGGEPEALAWLVSKGVNKSLPVLQHSPPASWSVLSWLGIGATAHDLDQVSVISGLLGAGKHLLGASSLDGLVAIWHFKSSI